MCLADIVMAFYPVCIGAMTYFGIKSWKKYKSRAETNPEPTTH